MSSKKLRCAICGEEAEQMILVDGLLFCSRDCIGKHDRAPPERKMTVQFYGDDSKIVDEQGMTLTYAMLDGVLPPTIQAGETWEITFRKVSSP